MFDPCARQRIVENKNRWHSVTQGLDCIAPVVPCVWPRPQTECTMNGFHGIRSRCQFARWISRIDGIISRSVSARRRRVCVCSCFLIECENAIEMLHRMAGIENKLSPPAESAQRPFNGCVNARRVVVYKVAASILFANKYCRWMGWMGELCLLPWLCVFGYRKYSRRPPNTHTHTHRIQQVSDVFVYA